MTLGQLGMHLEKMIVLISQIIFQEKILRDEIIKCRK